jgi:hypothetical protein
VLSFARVCIAPLSHDRSSSTRHGTGGWPGRATPPSLAAGAAFDERRRHASPTSTNRPPYSHPHGSADSRAPSSVLFSAAFLRMLPRGPKSVESPRVANALDGARRASVIARLRSPLLSSRSGVGLAGDRGWPYGDTRPVRALFWRALARAFLDGPSPACRSRPDLCRVGMRDSGQSLWHPCRAASIFRSLPRQNRLSPHRVNGEGFLGPRCLPSTSASLTRVACAATSTNPPATSMRLCRRTSASGALFSPSPPAFAFGSGRRPSPLVRMGATRSTSRSKPFGPARAVGGVERRSSTSAITFVRSWSTAVESFDPRRLDILYRCRFLRAGRGRVTKRAFAHLAAHARAETLVGALDPVPGCFLRDQGPASLSRMPAESHRPESFRPRVATAP